MAIYIDYDVITSINVGLTAILLLPISGMLCTSFWLARRGKDQARVAFTYLKVTTALAFLSLVLHTIDGALELVYQNDIYLTSARISLLSSLFSHLADVLLVMTLVELGNGFLFCLGGTRTGLQKAMRNAGVATCITLSVIAVASFAVFNQAYSQYLRGGLLTPDLYASAGRKLSAALDIILFVWAGALMVFGVLVFKKIKHNYCVLKSSANLFLAATILNLITRLYGIIYASVFALYDKSYWGREIYTAIMFLNPIMDNWVYTAIVALVFSIAIRKRDGLWSTTKPWVDGQCPPVLEESSGAMGGGQRNVGYHEEAGRDW